MKRRSFIRDIIFLSAAPAIIPVRSLGATAQQVAAQAGVNPVASGGGGGGSVPDALAYWKLDESSGNASDYTGNGHILTNVNTVPYAAAKIGNGVTPDSGSTEEMAAASAILGAGISAMSLACWMTRSASSQMGMIGWMDNATGMVGVQWYSDGNIYIPAGSSSIYLTLANSATGWHHFVVVYDGSLSSANRFKLYYDGAITSPSLTGTPGATLTAPANFRIGRSIVDGIYTANTQYDEVGVWNVALTAENVTTLYNSGTGDQPPW